MRPFTIVLATGNMQLGVLRGMKNHMCSCYIYINVGKHYEQLTIVIAEFSVCL